MTSKAKSFKENLMGGANPAMRFISKPEEPAASRPETKSRRVQMLIRPGLYTRIKTLAARQGISVNECMNLLLEGAVEEG
ncbi:MAG: hypothetical protein FWD16_01570 [Clostridia bacterium]|nr:hypothetical protein [Clostridia bacterium]